MDKYTRKDVDGAAATFARVLTSEHGTNTSRWYVRPGSPTYGRGWYLATDEAGGEHHLMYLGWSAREAYLTLSGAIKALDLTKPQVVTA